MDQKDFKKAPKQFCDNIVIGFADDYFLIAMSSGQNAIAYSLTPQHTKKLLQYLQKNVDDYENKNGKIEAEWNPNVKSPIQMDDLHDENKKDSNEN